MHKKYSHQSLRLISGVAPLPIGLDSTLVESHRNTGMALLPASLVSTLAELLESPPCAGSLSLLSPYSFFILNFFYFPFFIFTVHSTYSFQRWKRDPDLLRAEEVVPVEKYFIISLMFMLRFYPELTLLD